MPLQPQIGNPHTGSPLQTSQPPGETSDTSQKYGGVTPQGVGDRVGRGAEGSFLFPFPLDGLFADSENVL